MRPTIHSRALRPRIAAVIAATALVIGLFPLAATAPAAAMELVASQADLSPSATETPGVTEPTTAPDEGDAGQTPAPEETDTAESTPDETASPEETSAPEETTAPEETDPSLGETETEPAEGVMSSQFEAQADLSRFQAGLIISDQKFYAKPTMSAAQIQTFLNKMVPSCRSGYTCLKDFKQTTTNKSPDQMCTGYKGAANESAATIIAKVSQSCGISEKVLLVMLQKEQGLVMHTWPSDWRYGAAMGQGCPDDAPCDTGFAGFFNQVYGGAWQLKRYANPAGTSNYFNWYPIGATSAVRYHPNVSCGSGNVVVKNKATAALYYYTPYQPNAAAIKAGYGEGDGCSAYGNRNFYNYYNDWFGSTTDPAPTVPTVPGGPTVTGAIKTEWDRRGGASGQLGKPVENQRYVAHNGGGYVQAFERGRIWLQDGSKRAHSMGNGPFLKNFLAARAESGGWGWPLESPVCGLAQGGCSMKVSKGTIYYSSATGSQMVLPELNTAYLAARGPAGPWGYPSGGLLRGPNGSYEQPFQHTHTAVTSQAGVVHMPASIVELWHALDGLNGRYGYPLRQSTKIATTVSGRGVVQEFSGGGLYSSDLVGGFAFGNGPFRNGYTNGGGPEAFGWPAGPPTCGLAGGGCSIETQRGLVTFSPAAGTTIMSAATAKAWLTNRGPAWLGYPTARAMPVADGSTQQFQLGTFYNSPKVSVGLANGPMGVGYAALLGPTGRLGWPTAAATCGQPGGGCIMPVQNGMLVYGPSTQVRFIDKLLTNAWKLSGGTGGKLGYPIDNGITTGTILTQKFEKGTLRADRSTGKMLP